MPTLPLRLSLSGGRLRVVDGRGAYLTIGKEMLDADGLHAVANSMLLPA